MWIGGCDFVKVTKAMLMIFVMILGLSSCTTNTNTEATSKTSVRGYVYSPRGSCPSNNQACEQPVAVQDLEKFIYNHFMYSESETKLDVQVENLFTDIAMEQFLSNHPISIDELEFPIIQYEEHILMGWNQIVAEIETITGISTTFDVELSPVDVDTIIYFSMPLCESCARADKLFEEIKTTQEFQIVRIDISDESNDEIIATYGQELQFNRYEFTVPLVVIGDRYLEGFDEIKLFLQAYLENGIGEHTLIPQN